MRQNEIFLEKAKALRPVLNKKFIQAETNLQPLGKGDSICFDFGQHLVGYITFQLTTTGAHPDAPVWLRIKAAEHKRELKENVEDYCGWVSASWVQQEQVHVDVLPAAITLPRRYAFRYLEIEVMGISEKYKLIVEEVNCISVSSADETKCRPYKSADKQLELIDRTACRTLYDCMQDVFEDGPKRDRRLWLGDLRLQALTNYQTYQDNDLVKRCLYLFAGSTQDDGRIGAAVFVEPEIEVDDTVMFDYSLFFIAALLDYYEATDDRETLSELWPTAWRQIELSQELFDENDLVRDSHKTGWCFMDWNLTLNKQAGAQGVYLYCLNIARRIAEILEDQEKIDIIAHDYEKKKTSALALLFDTETGLFVSGSMKQISWASQIWMVLGGAAGSEVLERIEKAPDAISIVTPYMYHFYVQALIDTGQRDKALSVIRTYWGGMIKEGADTFWELYNPVNPDESPYGGTIVNSYCHAWSCTPAYFLRKYFS